MKQQSRAYLYGLAAVALWSTVASAFKITLRHLDPLELLLWSDLFAVFFLAVILLAGRRFPEVVRCSARQLRRSFVLGLLNPFLYYLILFKAYDLLPAQVAQPLNYTWALTLAVLSVPLLGQRIGMNDFAGLLVGYLGVLVIATGGHLSEFTVSSPLGVGLALGSTVIWALYWIYNTDDPRHPAVCLFSAFAFSLLPVSLCYFFFAELRLPPVPGLVGAAYVGLVEMCAAYILWLLAMRCSSNTAKVAVLIFLSPLLSLFLIRFFVGEIIQLSTIAGLVLIIGGLLVQKYARVGRRRVRDEG